MVMDFRKWVEGRCWDGYEPVPGKEPGEDGSCRPKKGKKKKKGKNEWADALESILSEGEDDDEDDEDETGLEPAEPKKKAVVAGRKHKASLTGKTDCCEPCDAEPGDDGGE